MTNEDQIVALFAKANPVPSLDVFDPVEPLDMDRLEKRAERSRGMTDTKTDQVRLRGPDRWRRLAPVLLIPVIVLVALLMLANRDREVEPAMPLPSDGALQPGTYYIPEGDMAPRRFTFTVPAGWANEEGWIIKNLEGEPINRYGVTNDVVLVTYFVTHVYTDICNWQGSLNEVGPTVDDLAAALVAQAGRLASAPADVTLGGFPAKRIELTVPADLDVDDCDGGNVRFWPDPGPDQSGGVCCVARWLDRCGLRSRRRRQHLRSRCEAHRHRPPPKTGPNSMPSWNPSGSTIRPRAHPPRPDSVCNLILMACATSDPSKRSEAGPT